MKMLLGIWLVWVSVTAFSQGQYVNFTDNATGNPSPKFEQPDLLAYWLTAPCKTDREKVTAIFHWITDNIAYKVRDKWSRNILNKASDPADTAGNWKSLNEMVAANVIRKRVAVCDGYARLFKTLCDYAGIPSEIITGYARTNINTVGNLFRANHTWNAVYFDSSWHLLDATWASGYVSYNGDEFIRHYDDSYFLAPPQQFIYDHYPEDLQWTLLADAPVLQEYNRTPFKYSAFIKNGIVSFKPAKGIIDAAVGDTVTIELETDNNQKRLRITDATIVDSAVLSETDSCGDKKPTGVISGRRIRYTYIVPSANVEWLHVLYNDEPVMRYRLRIRLRIRKDKFIAGR